MTNQAFIYIGLGFAAASLLAVLFNQILYRRAYKKAKKDLRGQIPLNLSELNAERDRLRAEFAVNLNKLEFKVAAMQQSELKLRIDANKANELKHQMRDTLNSYIKKAVRWEAAHENVDNITNILKKRLKLQNDKIDDLQTAEVKIKAEQKIYDDAKLNHQITEAKYLKLNNEQDTMLRQLNASEYKLDKVTKQHNLQSVELEEARKNNLIYEAKISEISTQMLFLSQELFAKKISIDLSEKAIDKYKNKLLTQKLQMRDASLKNKAIYAVKSRLEGTTSLDLTATPPKLEVEVEVEVEETTASIKKSSGNKSSGNKQSINTNNIAPPKLVHDANKIRPKAATGLRGRMNSMINGFDD